MVLMGTQIYFPHQVRISFLLQSRNFPLNRQQPALQQRLHVSAAICNQQDIDILAPNRIDDSIWFENNLAVVAQAERQ